ncbi:disintegrin and metalloproteinase domain-containing protein 10-like [Solea senegalensis]|uniref:ADAM10 endopeptidase n=1 Tax=Solea senegalensis TaxID=28829 RepID=A0AAV6SA34_SOLSE|nr:disintegrin and metalloproteinase domain-containing protein 10 isoform X1 [Solea senegalensis]KAG7513552.1 disintegrin and metalloproteinase domain-containing protein 10-like [Solea senegalensis]
MGVQLHWLLLLLVDCRELITDAVSDISPYIKHHEGLSYDRGHLHKMHLRARRTTQPEEHTLQLDFTAFHKTFRLRLKRNAEAFSQDFMVASENGSLSADLSHIYSGTLEGEHGSACHGSVLQGQFEGTIHTDDGTYHIEPVHRYTSNHTDHHSIIYHEDHMVLPPMGSNSNGFCGAEHLRVLAQSLRPSDEAPASRSRRTVDESKTSCLLHLHVDHLYYKKFKSVEAVVAQVASYMQAVNDIFDKVDFNGIRLINFKVKSLTVISEEDTKDPLSPLYIGPEKLLSLYSENNWGNFCLSYLLTNRDYSGVLGLAWEGKVGNWGGICSKYTTLRNGRMSTLNTGLVTVQNYGQVLPPRLVQLTFAHELGHSLGAPHDEGSNCGNLGSAGGKGKYLMFPQATDGVRENNDKFSHCSIKHISKTLRLKKDDCFVVSDQPICGNHIVEGDEECDVGHDDTDRCCYSAIEPVGVQCHLKPGKDCSPSQGLCCGQDCGFKSADQTCDEETDCLRESVCSGLSPLCPEPVAKENLTVCSEGTRVCLNGECAESVCVKHHLQQCDCPGDSMREKCHMCCQQPDKPETCASTTSSVLSRHFLKKTLPLVGGAPCFGNQGYCDKFHVCRLLDADGPIARLKNSFLHLDNFEDVGEWMKAHWWAILLAILTLSGVMGCTVCLCGQTLNTRDLE